MPLFTPKQPEVQSQPMKEVLKPSPAGILKDQFPLDHSEFTQKETKSPIFNHRASSYKENRKPSKSGSESGSERGSISHRDKNSKSKLAKASSRIKLVEEIDSDEEEE
eukprot:CAMPEP_0114579330 /NCGR_PEP_ID=MMETSP0125-20121206/3731_1 /TAXON_ID=485358 ORGANISM="Aristerostoma sp., Strain ATCC 50986" /NCGR_SAMPLE_ID=MMETSP0125 /ASSEMBLY_ACC=CAM_ASM_000245 /LENGTH=107 /DNA_ID=CAMNT_0001770015 /DNA_START=912 /DNA_END=1235 /DNA_ORIENTATION=-